MKAFNDTNVPVAYVFLFEPQCVMARHIICDEYDEVYPEDQICQEDDDNAITVIETFLNLAVDVD